MGIFTNLGALATLLCAVSAIDPLSIKGAKIFNSDGSQFYIKGVAYQLTPDDPLVDVAQCTADATLMKTLGVNSIRTYHVDPSQDHSGCMSVFADAGIYLWLDLDTFTTQIEQTAPAWTQDQFLHFAAVMDAFASFQNLAGFWIGNEVINTEAGSSAAPYVKAATADMKTYRDAKKHREFPVGYSAADIAELRPMLQNYVVCGDSAAQGIDFFGLNSYEWCGSAATYQSSGYSNLNDMAQGYPIPIFFSETGCNVGGPRTFNDQASILGPDMDHTWSGAIIYEWIEEVNNYGLISYPGGGVSGTPSPISPDFSNLQNQWKTLNPTGVSSAAYNPSNSAPPCPGATGGWQVNGDVPLPTLDPAIISSAAGGQLKLASTSAPATAAATPPPPTMTTSASSSVPSSGASTTQSSASGAATTASQTAASASPSKSGAANAQFSLEGGVARVGLVAVLVEVMLGVF